jgi:ComF family protein
MLDTLLSIVAPHHCCGCDEVGILLCDNCKYDIISEQYERCVACGKGLAGPAGICASCSVPYSRAWCVADRRDYLQQLIGNFKFTNARAAYIPLAGLLDERLPELPDSTVIVPVPTVSSHIRQRGYDHMYLVAKRFAKLRNLSVVSPIIRQTTTTQRGAGAKERINQAKAAFKCTDTLSNEKIYLLVDDVITSGATVKYATQVLMGAGAKTVWVATISRQPLD